jgi:hypothetical protein
LPSLGVSQFFLISQIFTFATNLHNLESLAALQKIEVATKSKVGRKKIHTQEKRSRVHKVTKTREHLRNVTRVSLNHWNTLLQRVGVLVCSWSTWVLNGAATGSFYSPKGAKSRCLLPCKSSQNLSDYERTGLIWCTPNRVL